MGLFPGSEEEKDDSLKKDIDFLGEKDLVEEDFSKDYEQDFPEGHLEPFEEDNYEGENEEEVEEMSFDDPFDSLEDLDDEDSEDDGNLF